MSQQRPGPGKHASGLAESLKPRTSAPGTPSTRNPAPPTPTRDPASLTSAPDSSSVSRAKRQRVEVTLDSNARYSSSTRPVSSSASGLPTLPTPSTSAPATNSASASIASTSRTLKRKSSAIGEADKPSSHAKNTSAAHTDALGPPPLDAEVWKKELRRLYSTDCTLPEKDIRSALEDLVLRLHDKRLKHTVLKYVADRVDLVQDDHDNALDKEKGLGIELESALVQLKAAQRKVDGLRAGLTQAKGTCEGENEKLARVMNIRDVLRDLVADAEDVVPNKRVEHDGDDVVANDDISQAPQIVEGKGTDIVQTHNAIFIAGHNNTIPVSLKRFKIWPLLASTDDAADDDDDDTPPAFCTPESVVETPAHLTCKRCQEGPREIHGFPGSTTYSAHPRCLFNLNSKSESVACVACLRSNRARLDRCGIDEKAVREWLVQQQLLKQ